MTTDKINKDENLNVLALEDSARDFELIKEQLIDAGYILTIERVETENAFTDCLRTNPYDIILADFKLPGFDAFSALRIRNEICPDTPFICVSGSIGEETAVDMLKSGAMDYVIKDRPDRLPFAIDRALDEAREKKIRKQNEAELQKVTTAVEQAGEVIFITDPDGIIQYVNPAFTTVTGYSREEIVGQNPRLLKSGKQDQAFYQDLWGTIASGRTWKGLLVNKRKDGALYTEDATISPVKDTSGRTRNYVAVQRDITEFLRIEEERAKLQDQFHQAQKMEAMGTLAGGIAHDFNNILFPIIGHADMLLDDIPKDSPVRKSLEQIHTGALRARELVHQILAFSRQEKNELARMKIQPIVKEALKLIRSTIPTTIAINQRLHSSCGPVKADPVQIHQIIMNLATNAYHAMVETGGTLTVSLNEIQVESSDPVSPDLQPGTYACLSVADTGTGMDKETAEKIFDPFFTTKKRGKGTGMGLSVVHGIVKAMNGTIQVQTEPGRGTAFHLFLPVAENGAAENTPLIKEPLVGGSEHILLVDDEKPVIAIEKQLLSRLGYQVTGCTGSIEALEMFSADPDRYDMVITDIAMPKMSGDKLAGELLKIRSDIPILLCTGFSETMTDEKMAAIGVKGLLMKPFVINDLDKKLRKIFG